MPDVRDPRYGYKTEEEFKRREVKWIWKENYDHVFPEQQHEYAASYVAGKTIPVLCNHCDNPPCVRVCPTQATWKRESDGIVMMDMHRCIGCRYCMVGCPYGARCFNWQEPWPRPYAEHGTPPNLDYPTRTKGVVEKCNFCAERLVAAEREGKPFVPACVEVCPANGADLRRHLGRPPLPGPEAAGRRRYTIRRKTGPRHWPQRLSTSCED